MTEAVEILFKTGDIADQFVRAQEIRTRLDDEVSDLSVKMFAWISAKLPPGTVIDLRHPKVRADPTPLPMYLRFVKVLVGNARGSHIFGLSKCFGLTWIFVDQSFQRGLPGQRQSVW